MEKRRLGRTGHMSTVAILGAVAYGRVSQEATDASMQQVIEMGINHIDVAPTYGDAELRVGPWMARERKRFFLGCKTTQRTRQTAADELQRSLKRLQTDHLDLYQLHAITTFEELDQVTGPGGALETIIAARDQGLTRFIGITGHGLLAPKIFIEALKRFDFDTVLFPINFKLFADDAYRQSAEQLLELCQAKDVGTMIIKSIAKGPWGEDEHTHHTWYRPFTDPEMIQKGVNFVLSQKVTGLCTAGDLQVLPTVLQSCEKFTPLSRKEQDALIKTADAYQPIFTPS